MAAMGSKEAYAILDQAGETAYANYAQRMGKVRNEISALQLDSWTQNLYWTWLYSLQPLVEPKGVQYPAFMQTQAWTRKDLHTALGSWTELKHDTILYAKQVMAEMGGGAEEPAPPRSWVEPNPEAYARLLTLTRMTNDGLKSRSLLSKNTSANLARLDSLLAFLLDVSQQELAGKTLSQKDYERIKYIGGELEAMTLAAADPEGEGRPFFSEDDQAALVADVATDPNGQVLEEATGRVFEIFAVVPDGRGGLHITKWRVLYYEFPCHAGSLTDESWRPRSKPDKRPLSRIGPRALSPGNRAGKGVATVTCALLILCLVVCLPGEPAPPTFTLAFGGDVMLGRGVARALGGDWSAAFAESAERLAEADLTLANLESLLTNEPQLADGYDLRAMPAAVGALHSAGFDAVSLANNHALDAGKAGLAETVATLDSAGIAGVTSHTTGRLVSRIPPIKSLRYQLFAFDDSTIPLDVEAAACRDWQNAAELVIISIHWGGEYRRPRPRQRSIAEALARAGADLVIGHGPHVLQPVERIGKTLVAYSLGNLLFDQLYPEDSRWGAILRVTLTSQGRMAFELLPTVTERGRVRPANPGEARAILARLSPEASPGEGAVRSGFKPNSEYRHVWRLQAVRTAKFGVPQASRIFSLGRR
jgi:poly-gamma-glutamate capsule biosynthesis protein CapA/YwtB (metallophosphatase superfamily)